MLREFCELWVDQGPTLLCCQTCEPQIADEESAHFDCETCPLARALEALDGDNALAWTTYGRIYSRFHHDWGLIPTMFARVIDGFDPEDVTELTERLAVIYDILQPPPPERQA